MCRYNQLWGSVLLAFGLGVLVGLWVDGGFFAHCFGGAIILIGCGVITKS